MKLEPGKYYKRRDGKVVGMRYDYCAAGRRYKSGPKLYDEFDHDEDLIECVPNPNDTAGFKTFAYQPIGMESFKLLTAKDMDNFLALLNSKDAEIERLKTEIVCHRNAVNTACEQRDSISKPLDAEIKRLKAEINIQDEKYKEEQFNLLKKNNTLRIEAEHLKTRIKQDAMDYLADNDTLRARVEELEDILSDNNEWANEQIVESRELQKERDELKIENRNLRLGVIHQIGDLEQTIGVHETTIKTLEALLAEAEMMVDDLYADLNKEIFEHDQTKIRIPQQPDLETWVRTKLWPAMGVEPRAKEYAALWQAMEEGE